MIPLSDENPTAQCPSCKAMHVDYDGFGVLWCEHCGYCAHPSITAGVCDLCSRPQGDDRG